MPCSAYLWVLLTFYNLYSSYSKTYLFLFSSLPPAPRTSHSSEPWIVPVRCWRHFSDSVKRSGKLSGQTLGQIQWWTQQIQWQNLPSKRLCLTNIDKGLTKVDTVYDDSDLTRGRPLLPSCSSDLQVSFLMSQIYLLRCYWSIHLTNTEVCIILIIYNIIRRRVNIAQYYKTLFSNAVRTPPITKLF